MKPIKVHSDWKLTFWTDGDMSAVPGCPMQTCWDSLEFPTFSGISQWWSFEGWTNDPITWLQSWWTSSNKQIWAAVGITSLKEASRLTQMATDVSSFLSCGRWRISCAASWGRAPYRSKEDSSMVPNSGSCISWTQLGIAGRWWLHCQLLFELMPSGAILKNKQNRHRKDTQSAALSCNTSWSVLLQEVNEKQGKCLFTKWVLFFVQMLLNNVVANVFSFFPKGQKNSWKCRNSESLSKYASFLGKNGLGWFNCYRSPQF